MKKLFTALLLLIGTTCFSQKMGKLYHSDTVIVYSCITHDTLSITARKDFEVTFNVDGTALLKKGGDSVVLKNMEIGKYTVLPSTNIIKMFNVKNVKTGKDFLLTALTSSDSEYLYIVGVGNSEMVYLISIENK